MLSRRNIGTKGQFLIVLLTISAWFCLSNHCALALVKAVSQPVAAAEENACPMHSTPTKKKEPAANVPCCKDLRAVTAKSAIKPMTAPIRLMRSQDYVAEISLVPPRIAIEVKGFDTGPPGAFSFAESVLQQSILAHAPPLS